MDNVFDHLLQLGPGQLLHQVLWSGGICRDERQVDLGLHGGRKLDLGFLSRIAQALQRHLIALGTQVEPFIFLELFHQPLDNALVDIVATQMRITIGGLHLDHTFAHFQDGNIEGPAAKVVDGDGLVFLLVQPISQRGSGWLIDDALYVETGDLAGVFGCLALRVIEIGRNRNDRFGHRMAEMVFRGLLQFLKNQRRDLRWSVFLSLRHDGHMVTLANHFVGDHLHLVVHFLIPAAHETLDGINCIFGIGNCLPLGNLADQTLSRFGEGNHGWGRPATFFVRDDLGFATFHHGHDGIRGTQVNSYNFAHG